MSMIAPSEITASYAHAFNVIPGIGPQKLFLLERSFDSLADAWHADHDSLIQAGLSSKLADTIIDARKEIGPLIEWQKLKDTDITVLIHNDTVFPKKLKNIPHPPFCLYVRGCIAALNTDSVAIVGSRKISTYGTQATMALSTDIAYENITIISGLALGTDTIAHKSALDASGTTIAVLAGGINDAMITPRANTNIAREIIAHGGAIISEYPCDTQPNRGTFPTRNRLMAALSDAVIIIEAAEGSGTMITAKYAKEYKKPLFALPGSIFSKNALGPNTLIQSGDAQAILSSNDVLTLFDKKANTHTKCITFSDKTKEKIYTVIEKCPEGMHINRIIKETTLDATTVSSTLTLLEIDGIIKNIGNQTYTTSQY